MCRRLKTTCGPSEASPFPTYRNAREKAAVKVPLDRQGRGLARPRVNSIWKEHFNWSGDDANFVFICS